MGIRMRDLLDGALGSAGRVDVTVDSQSRQRRITPFSH
jgi:hypothetical protein